MLPVGVFLASVHGIQTTSICTARCNSPRLALSPPTDAHPLSPSTAHANKSHLLEPAVSLPACAERRGLIGAMSLDQLPDDIIQHLLYCLSPGDTLSGFQLTCRRFALLSSEPLIWRYHCVNAFRYWHPGHEFPVKVRAPVAEVDWKGLFIFRRSRNCAISKIFDEILETKVCRFAKIGSIAELGYDAKDFLLEQTKCSEAADDVLARRSGLLPKTPSMTPSNEFAQVLCQDHPGQHTQECWH